MKQFSFQELDIAIGRATGTGHRNSLGHGPGLIIRDWPSHESHYNDGRSCHQTEPEPVKWWKVRPWGAG
eukprot:1159796-Pelagomonas_calceolata.AAC.14